MERLVAGVDYLWCPACRKHVRCIRLETGWWEVECPRCTGECGYCKCGLRELCIGVHPEWRGEVPLEVAGPECPFLPKDAK